MSREVERDVHMWDEISGEWNITHTTVQGNVQAVTEAIAKAEGYSPWPIVDVAWVGDMEVAEHRDERGHKAITILVGRQD